MQLSLREIYQTLDQRLPPEKRDELFWYLAGERTRKTWAWFQQHNAEATWETFWFGTAEEAHTWEPEKYFLKGLQDQWRDQAMLPGMLSLVRDPFWLDVMIEVIISGALFNTVSPHLHVNLFYAAGVSQNVQQALADWAYQQQPIPAEMLKQAIKVGLMNEQGQFIHEQWQRYFENYGRALELQLAMHQGVSASEYWTSEEWWQPTVWDESAMLLVTLQGNAEQVVRWLASTQPTLAYYCSYGDFLPELLFETKKLLYEPPQGSRVSPIWKSKGLLHESSHDQRPGVGLRGDGLPDMQWCEIPAGKFQMGGDPQAINAWAGQEIDLPYTYVVSQYLITKAQYQAFMAADGYQNSAYWTETGWYWKGERSQPDYWEDIQFWGMNCPVLGVSWYEAMAFAEWLNQGLEHPAGTVIRLLTEAEWEKAARYPDGRFYPWGDEYIPTSANVNETSDTQNYIDYTIPNKLHYLGRTSPVGTYAPSPAGIYDLNGNLWEWCLSEWRDPYQHPENNTRAGSLARVMRGGSWNYAPEYARSASRIGYPAEIRGGTAIRLALAPL